MCVKRLMQQAYLINGIMVRKVIRGINHLPTTPNPTSGVLIFVPNEDIIPLDMSVEDAMKLIISAGTVTPDIKLPVIKADQ